MIMSLKPTVLDPLEIDKKSKFSFEDKDTGWNKVKKTEKEKELLSARGKLLNMRLRYPLNLKIEFAKRRITHAIHEYGIGNCYISFSGGKDSTVLSHIALSLGYRLEHVYSNTRLEYPECIVFAKKWCKKNKVKLTIVTPEVLPYEIWKKHGYPMFSKTTAEILERLRLGYHVSPKKLNRVKKFLKYKNVKISAKCCLYLKKKPLKEWQKISGKKVAIMGMRVEESTARRLVWIRKGCMYHTKEQVVINPISFFTEKDILAYAKKFHIKFADIYYKGLRRNGCYCCGFGSHLTGENNFVSLKRLNPNLWANVMNHWGYEKICRQCGIKTE